MKINSNLFFEYLNAACYRLQEKFLAEYGNSETKTFEEWLKILNDSLPHEINASLETNKYKKTYLISEVELYE